MRRNLVTSILVLNDAVIALLAPFLALLVRFDGNVAQPYYDVLLKYLPLILTARIFIYFLFRMYHRLWRYASIHELIIIISAVSVSSLIITGFIQYEEPGFPRSIHILSWVFNILLVGASRLAIRVLHYLLRRLSKQQPAINVLVIGAGDAGAMIARELIQRYYDTKKLVGFIDDASYKQSQSIFGVKILGTRSDITRIVAQCNVQEIIIAMPSIEGAIIREILTACKETKCNVKILPGIYELIDGKVTVQQLRNVDVEDLLRRESVKLDLEEIASYTRGKRILVTGAGGSIGSELCRQIARLNPESLLLLGKGENSIYEIHMELKEKFRNLNITPIIADVRDQSRIHEIFNAYKPEVVFHAAAHKHVPLMEVQPIEAVKNNIFGTKNVAEAADRHHTEIFVMISTDKAVNPTSVMGATKRVAELIIQNQNKISNTKFVTVRFGNVLGSRGSVIPLFKKQIAKGGPITITHPEMKRYFMTIPEAVQLVLQAGSMAKGGEVFVLDMGEPVKIVDMAKDLVELSGLIPGKDIEILFTGLRPGEKLFEELLTAEEGTSSTKHSKIYVANIKEVDETKLQQGLIRLHEEQNGVTTIKIIQGLVPTYTSKQVQGVIKQKNNLEEDECSGIREQYISAVSQ